MQTFKQRFLLTKTRKLRFIDANRESINSLGSIPPVSVAGDRVPPLVLIDVDALDISLCVNVIGAAGQSLEEASTIAPSVDPGSVIVTNPPHYPNAVTLHGTQVTSNLPPEPAQKKLLIKADNYGKVRQKTRNRTMRLMSK